MDLSAEKNYNLQLFVDEQVTQMCQRSYFSFNLMAKENQIKAFVGQDEQRTVNKEDSGHRRKEQNGFTKKSVVASANGFQAKLANNQS